MGAVRPRFEISSGLHPDELVSRVGRTLLTRGCPVSGLAAKGCLELHVHEEDQHLWSPQLIVELFETETGTLLRSRFGPHPSVWTLYMAGYAACAFGILVGLSFAYAEWVMGQPLWGLWCLPIVALVVVGLYGLAFVGQSAGHEQMQRLRDFLEGAIAD